MPWNESSLSQTSGPISPDMTVKVSSLGLTLMVGRWLIDVQENQSFIPSFCVFHFQGQNEDPGSILAHFKRLSHLRGKERSLLHGDFHALASSSGLFSYIRHWDQNERYLVVLNFQDVSLSARLEASNLPAGISLPASANLLVSTNSTRLSQEEGTSLKLENLSLNPHEGLLLNFPYVA